jgi:hypothetical protein
MDRSRFPSGSGVTFVRNVTELSGGDADLVIVDLNREGALEAAGALQQVRRIGFTNHENTELIQAAQAAGIEVMPRSRFFRTIADIVAQ